jgi:hypothetical protein
MVCFIVKGNSGVLLKAGFAAAAEHPDKNAGERGNKK